MLREVVETKDEELQCESAQGLLALLDKTQRRRLPGVSHRLITHERICKHIYTPTTQDLRGWFGIYDPPAPTLSKLTAAQRQHIENVQAAHTLQCGFARYQQRWIARVSDAKSGHLVITGRSGQQYTLRLGSTTTNLQIRGKLAPSTRKILMDRGYSVDGHEGMWENRWFCTVPKYWTTGDLWDFWAIQIMGLRYLEEQVLGRAVF